MSSPADSRTNSSRRASLGRRFVADVAGVACIEYALIVALVSLALMTVLEPPAPLVHMRDAIALESLEPLSRSLDRKTRDRESSNPFDLARRGRADSFDGVSGPVPDGAGGFTPDGSGPPGAGAAAGGPAPAPDPLRPGGAPAPGAAPPTPAPDPNLPETGAGAGSAAAAGDEPPSGGTGAGTAGHPGDRSSREPVGDGNAVVVRFGPSAESSRLAQTAAAAPSETAEGGPGAAGAAPRRTDGPTGGTDQPVSSGPAGGSESPAERSAAPEPDWTKMTFGIVLLGSAIVAAVWLLRGPKLSGRRRPSRRGAGRRQFHTR